MQLAFWKRKSTATDQENPKKKKKPVWREWLDAAIFAIIAATIIRTFFIEAYTIPTPSMEGTMLVNDYLFVSKIAYGARLPMTPLSLPLVHNTLPLIGGKSYVESVQWKYRRLPGFGKVKRYDVVVFNFPNNDTVIAEDPAADYYYETRLSSREHIWNNNTIITRPVDKKENYIKRCVGIPGDKIEVIDGTLFVNGQKAPVFPHQRMDYLVYAEPGFFINQQYADENNIISKVDHSSGTPYYEMEEEVAEKVKKLPGVKEVIYAVTSKGMVVHPGALAYPQEISLFPWNQDNFGPIVIPKKGTTVPLTQENISLYRRLIEIYEKNNFEIKNGKVFIAGKEATQYTFKMDYYWMMGDNRHNSLDSRFWGFVPDDHIVGKASFVWLSYGKGGIRWSRLFRGVKKLEQ